MMKRAVKIVGLLLLLGVIAVGIILYLGRTRRPTADELFAEVLEKYATLEDYEESCVVNTQVNMGGSTITQETPTTIKFKPPNKLYLASEGETPEQTIVSDGENLYEYVPMLKQCRKTEAPETLEEIAALKQGDQMLGTNIGVLDLLTGQDIAADVTSMALGEDEELDGISVYVLELELTDGNKEKLWIGKKDHLVRQAQIESKGGEWARSMSEKGADTGEGPEAEGPAAALADMFKDMSIVRTQTAEDIKVNGGLPDSAFAFEPPEGVEIVAEFKFPGVPEAANLTGEEAPDFTVKDLDGNEVTLSKLRGTPILLDFWATWCPPCREEMPSLQAIHEKYGGKGLRIIAISSDMSEDTVREYVKKEGLTFTVAHVGAGPDETTSADYKVTGIPRVLFIDGDGIIREDFTGLHEQEDLEEALGKIGIERLP